MPLIVQETKSYIVQKFKVYDAYISGRSDITITGSSFAIEVAFKNVHHWLSVSQKLMEQQ